MRQEPTFLDVHQTTPNKMLNPFFLADTCNVFPLRNFHVHIVKFPEIGHGEHSVSAFNDFSEQFFLVQIGLYI